MQIQPYLFFNGDCEQALAFYHRTLGGVILHLMRVSDAPGDLQCPISDPHKILHAELKLGDSVLMMSDGNADQPAAPSRSFALSIPAPSLTQGEKWFNALAEGGQVTVPFGETFWAAGFGMLTDKFGIPWMINVEHPQ